MIAVAVLLGVLVLAVVLVLALPAGDLPGDHAPDFPPLTRTEIREAREAEKLLEGKVEDESGY